MINILSKKSLAGVLIVLLVGAAFLPNICGDVQKKIDLNIDEANQIKEDRLFPHDYYNEIPNYWTQISTGYFDNEISNTYQCALRDDYYGNGKLVTITDFHHGHVGIFKETNQTGSWVRTPISECFDPENTTGIPVKGIFSINTDTDSYPEIITASDETRFFLMNASQKRWTGPIFIDLNDQTKPIIQILVWGQWGDQITGQGPVLKPIQIDPHFRKSTNLLPDIMLNILPPFFGRLIVLEQPPQGFKSINYTFDGQGNPGVYPYEEEPFYVKHLYEFHPGSGLISELIWNSSEVVGANGVYLSGIPYDADGDENMDLVVAGTYFHNDTFNVIQSRISVYKRLPSLEYTYLFEEVFTQNFTNSHFWGIGGYLDCDGVSSNGKESIALEFTNNDTTSQRTRPTGFTVLKKTGELFSLDFIEIPENIEYPYINVYSHMGIYDWNSDGYDDIVVWTNEALSPVLYGDLNLWLNTGNFSGHSFRYDEKHCFTLLDNHAIFWGVSQIQMDDDPVPEISICSAVREHYWEPLQGGKYAYGMDVFDYIHDTTPPQLFDVHDFPDPQQAGGFVNISCYVTDNVQVNTVKVNIDGPNGFTPLNVSMNRGDNNLYFDNRTYTIPGTYTYSIWAIDTIGNQNRSVVSNFIIGFFKNLNNFPMYSANATLGYHEMCGPAVAQMTLNYMWWNSSNSSTPPMTFDNQTWLYTMGHANNTDTNTTFLDTQGLWKLLQTYLPLPYTTYGYNFAKNNNINQTYMLRQICTWINYTIGTYGGHKPGHPLNVPAIVPTYGNYSNWMAVRGFHSDLPAYPLPSNLTVYGFWVNDPYPPSLGGMGENSYKTIDQWNTQYYLPLVSNDTYNGKYVAICEPPEDKKDVKLTLAASPARFTAQQKQLIKLTQAEATPLPELLIDQSNQWIIQAAIAGVNEQLLPYDSDFATVFRQTTPGQPLFVKNLNGGNDYYIVPFNKLLKKPIDMLPEVVDEPQIIIGTLPEPVEQPLTLPVHRAPEPIATPPLPIPEIDDVEAIPLQRQSTTVVVLIDANDGSFKEASWTQEPVKYLPISKDEAQKLVLQTLKTSDRNSNAYTIQPELVYRGSSPYYPDWRISVKDHGVVFYVNQEGQVSTS